MEIYPSIITNPSKKKIYKTNFISKTLKFSQKSQTKIRNQHEILGNTSNSYFFSTYFIFPLTAIRSPTPSSLGYAELKHPSTVTNVQKVEQYWINIFWNIRNEKNKNKNTLEIGTDGDDSHGYSPQFLMSNPPAKNTKAFAEMQMLLKLRVIKKSYRTFRKMKMVRIIRMYVFYSFTISTLFVPNPSSKNFEVYMTAYLLRISFEDFLNNNILIVLFEKIIWEAKKG